MLKNHVVSIILLGMASINTLHAESSVSDIDILGIKVGMQIDEVKQIVDSSEYQIKMENNYGFEYIGGKGARKLRGTRTLGYIHAFKTPQPYDDVFLHFSPGPDAGQLFEVTRNVRYHNVKAPSHDNLISAMEGKYGNPSFIFTTNSGGTSTYAASWIFDKDGAKYNETPVSTKNIAHEFKKICGGGLLIDGERRGINKTSKLYTEPLQKDMATNRNKQRIGIDKLEKITCSAYLQVLVWSNDIQVTNFSISLVDYELKAEKFRKVLTLAEQKITDSYAREKEKSEGVAVPNL